MIDSKWIPLIIPSGIVVLGLLGLTCFFISYQKQRRHRPKVERSIRSTQKTTKSTVSPSATTHVDSTRVKTSSPSPQPVHDPPSNPKQIHLSTASSIRSTPVINPSLSSSSSQLTRTDVFHLEKLLHAASDRSMWKNEPLTTNLSHKPRKVPSAQSQEKFANSELR